MTEPVYFATAAEFGRWLAEHAASASEITVGFVKRRVDAGGMTWPQAVDEALCHGWIDGVRRRVDDDRYTVRFTPRKPGSTWSAVNVDKMAALEAAGRLAPAGAAAFRQRTEGRSGTYSYEQRRDPELSQGEAAALEEHPAAAAFFAAQPPGYRKKVVWWVVSARRPETRAKRFAAFVNACRRATRL